MAARAVVPRACASLVSNPLRHTMLAEACAGIAARTAQATRTASTSLSHISLAPAPSQAKPLSSPGAALGSLYSSSFLAVGATPALCAASAEASSGVPALSTVTGGPLGPSGGAPALATLTGGAQRATGGVPGLCVAAPGAQELLVPFSLRGLHSGTPPPKETLGEAVREATTTAVPMSGREDKETQKTPSDSNTVTFSDGVTVEKMEDKSGGSYWSIQRPKLYREDGTEWPWRSFTPADTYRANTQVALDKHFKPNNFGDTFAKYLVKSLRIPTDLFFQRRYGCRAMMLETVAAVPGMVAGMLLHLKSLRLIEHTGGWIKTLLDEAENERMHLMTFMEVAQPKWYERAIIFSVQAVFFTAYTGAYIVSPRIAHRVVGYLEEEAVHSYTEYLKDIDAGKIENIPAPQIAIDYWRLPKDATLRDVVMVVRADEAHHRDVNHFAANIVQEGKKLKDYPAPIDYH